MSSSTLDAAAAGFSLPYVATPSAAHPSETGSRGGTAAGSGTGTTAGSDAGSDAGTTAGADPLKALVLRARDGDAEAFGGLYDHYVDLVYRYIYYRVGSHPLAEDLTSETFLRALRRMPAFNWQGKDFGAWLVTIARNLVTDHFKSGRYRLEICTAELLETGRVEDGPERAVLDAMTHRTLLEAVRRLGSDQQECIVLRFLHGLSVAETALVMGRKTGAIKALQYRAVRALGRMLPPDLVTA